MDNSWSGRRDHPPFLFLCNTGARVSEALSVRAQDVQRDGYWVVQLLSKAESNARCSSRGETPQHIRVWLKCAALNQLPNCFGRPVTRTAVQQRFQLHVQTAQTNCPSLRQRRISSDAIRHYLAFLIMSCNGESQRIWTGDFRFRCAKQPDIILCQLQLFRKARTPGCGRRWRGRDRYRICSTGQETANNADYVAYSALGPVSAKIISSFGLQKGDYTTQRCPCYL